MRAEDVMSAFPVKVERHTDLASAARRLVTLGVHHLPVVDDRGVLVGMVYDHDLFSRGGFLGELWVVFEEEDERLTVGDVMEAVPVEVTPEDDLTVVLRRMATGAHDSVVVVDAARHPVGILTEHDVLRLAIDLVPEALRAQQEASAPVVAVAGRERAPVAWARMHEARIRHLPVLDDDGRVVGVVSLRDLLSDDAAHRPELRTEDVVRSDEVRTAAPEASLREVASLMLVEHVGCVPLVNDRGRPVAIVTRRDILGAAVAALEAEALFPSATEE